MIARVILFRPEQSAEIVGHVSFTPLAAIIHETGSSGLTARRARLRVVFEHALAAPAKEGGAWKDLFGELRTKVHVGGTLPRSSCDQSRQSTEDEARDLLTWRRAGQVDLDPGLHLDDPGGDLYQLKAQGVELGHAPGRPLRRKRAVWRRGASRSSKALSRQNAT